MMTVYYYDHYKQISSSSKLFPWSAKNSFVLECNDTAFNVTYFYIDSMAPANQDVNTSINASFVINSPSCGISVNMMFSDDDSVLTLNVRAKLTLTLANTTSSDELLYYSHDTVLWTSLRLY